MKKVYVGIISHDIYIYTSHDLNTNAHIYIYIYTSYSYIIIYVYLYIYIYLYIAIISYAYNMGFKGSKLMPPNQNPKPHNWLQKFPDTKSWNMYRTWYILILESLPVSLGPWRRAGSNQLSSGMMAMWKEMWICRHTTGRAVEIRNVYKYVFVFQKIVLNPHKLRYNMVWHDENSPYKYGEIYPLINCISK